VGLVLGIIWRVTNKNSVWLMYTSLGLLLFGVVYNMVDDWKQGKKKLVKIQLLLLAGGLLLAVFLRR
jgi:lipoprotein signal peptidase